VPIERVTPVFIHHPVFEEPSHDATLWRYMDFTRFVALLEHRALFFSGISGFPDRFEASLTPRLTAQLEAMGGQALDDWRNWPRLTFLNCWNEDAHENVALWNTYASAAGGVAIKSSLNRILQALHPDDSGLIPPDELHAGRVRYVDYATATIPHDNATGRCCIKGSDIGSSMRSAWRSGRRDFFAQARLSMTKRPSPQRCRSLLRGMTLVLTRTC
jgi:hypothetical protein